MEVSKLKSLVLMPSTEDARPTSRVSQRGPVAFVSATHPTRRPAQQVPAENTWRPRSPWATMTPCAELRSVQTNRKPNP